MHVGRDGQDRGGGGLAFRNDALGAFGHILLTAFLLLGLAAYACRFYQVRPSEHRVIIHLIAGHTLSAKQLQCMDRIQPILFARCRRPA